MCVHSIRLIVINGAVYYDCSFLLILFIKNYIFCCFYLSLTNNVISSLIFSIMNKIAYYTSNDFIAKVFGKISYQTYWVLIFLLGLLIRGRQYLTNRSFWLDEAFLALNFRERGFMKLLEPLDYSQIAPIGFLWVEKLMGNVFGVNELSLRFIPFLASLIAIYLLYDLTRIVLNKHLALIVTFAFIILPNLTYFSSELKQYMTDLFTALVMYWYFFRYVYKNYNNINVILLGVIGALSVWLSNITPIVLLAIGLPIWMDILRNKSYNKLIPVVLSNALWLLSFYFYYIHFIKDHPHRQGMEIYWADSFMPHQPIEAITWLFDRLFFVFKNTISHYELAIPAMLFFFAGVGSIFRKKAKRELLIFLLPILIHLVLSFAKMYPFNDRLVLYLIPFFLIFEIVGIDFFASLSKKRYAVTVVLSSILLTLSFLRVPNFIVHPIIKEDIKPVLEYVKEHKEKDDIVYAYSGAHAAFNFYKEKYFSKQDSCIIGISSADHYDQFVNEFNNLHNRVWVVFSHMNPPQGLPFMDAEISKYKQLDYVEVEGAKAYLIQK